MLSDQPTGFEDGLSDQQKTTGRDQPKADGCPDRSIALQYAYPSAGQILKQTHYRRVYADGVALPAFVWVRLAVHCGRRFDTSVQMMTTEMAGLSRPYCPVENYP